MSEDQIILSSAGLKNIASYYSAEDFVFDVSGSLYHCNNIQADFISPNISKLHQTDPTINIFQLKTDDCEQDFQFFMDLMNGNPVFVDKTKIPFYAKVCQQIGNMELIDHLCPLDDISLDLTIDNIASRIATCELYHLDNTMEIEFASLHFSEIPNSILSSFSLDVLHQILDSPALLIRNEGYLLDFIAEQIETRGKQFISLLSHVKITQLTNNEMSFYLSMLDLDSIDAEIWEQLITRMLYEAPNNQSMKDFGFKDGVFLPSEGHEFDGLIHHLWDEYGENPIEEGVIKVMASSTLTGNVNNLFEYSDFSSFLCWNLRNELDGYVEVDFCDHRVNISHYSMRTPTDGGYDNDYPKTWSLEGSNDGIRWKLLDKRINDESLHGEDLTATFECENVTNESFRYIRLYQRGTSHFSGGYQSYMYISTLEFFGSFTQ